MMNKDFIQKHLKIINNALKSKLNILKRSTIYNVHQLLKILGLFMRIKDFIQKLLKIINNALKLKFYILKRPIIRNVPKLFQIV